MNWITVLTTVDQETFARVQQRLKDNKRFAARNAKVPWSRVQWHITGRHVSPDTPEQRIVTPPAPGEPRPGRAARDTCRSQVETSMSRSGDF